MAWSLLAVITAPFALLAVRLDHPAADQVHAATRTPVPALAAAPTSTTIVTSLPPSTSPPTTTTAPATVSTSASTTTTSTSTGSATGAPDIEPGPLRPASPGRYDVRIVDDGSSTDGALTVDRSGHQDMTVGGSTVTRLVAWTAAGDALRASHDPGEPDCVWSPAPNVMPRDLQEGRDWSSKTTCATSDASGTSTVTRQEDGAITSRARTTFDGAPLDCWLVRRHIVETITSATATVTTEAVLSELFAPSLGLPVYTVERMDVPAADGSVRSALWSTELVDYSPY